MKRQTSGVVLGVLLAIAGIVVAFLAIVVVLMVAPAFLPDHNAPLKP